MLFQGEKVVTTDEIDVWKLLAEGRVKSALENSLAAEPIGREQNDRVSSVFRKILCVFGEKGVFALGEKADTDGAIGKLFSEIAVAPAGFDPRSKQNSEREGDQEREEDQKKNGGEDDQCPCLEKGEKHGCDLNDQSDRAKPSEIRDSAFPSPINARASKFG